MTNNFILVVGNRDSEELSTIRESLSSLYWGYYDAAENGRKATELYLEGTPYNLVVMAGGFRWEEYTISCPIQSLVLTGYMRMWYKSEKISLPAVIVYEPNESQRNRLNEMLEGEQWAEVTITGTREELNDRLDNWWVEHTTL